MGYTVRNIDDSFVFTFSDREWIHVLDNALERGWKPMGTSLDFNVLVSLECDDHSFFGTLFTVLSIHERCLSWDGNYRDKEFQIVCEEDALELFWIYQASDLPGEFVSLLGAGSFRIYDCPEK